MTLYKTAITVFAYNIMKNADFFPTMLGGTGDYSTIFNEFPYKNHIPYLKEYYMICTSYHSSRMLHHLIYNRTNDFVEMTLHHTVTIYLLVGSYMFNTWESGAVISFLHDASDIFQHLTKMWTSTTLDSLSVTSAACCITSWAYMRCYILPFCVYTCWT